MNNLTVLAAVPPTFVLATSNEFGGVPSSLKVFVPDGSVDLYKSAAVWNVVASEILPQ